MFEFPKNLYTDVRIEHIHETSINFTNNVLENNKVRAYSGAIIRVFDGQRWYYKSISNLSNIQKEIEDLSKMAKENEKIYEHEVIKKLQVNKGEYLSYKGLELDKIPREDKFTLAKEALELTRDKKEGKNFKVNYDDSRVVKEFYSSKGSNLKFDYQLCGIKISYSFNVNGKSFEDNSRIATYDFNKLKDIKNKFQDDYNESLNYAKNSKPITPGKYTVVMSPLIVGVFAHESFGHKSEADFMIGDENMMKEWKIGTKVGADILSIVDYGGYLGSGYVPFDDEGTKAEKTYLIKDGILTGRLHSARSAAIIGEELTGNARAVSFEFEPIVRMTSTYIAPGDKTKEELIQEVEEGIYICDCKYGTGMSTFTIAPSRAYMIRNGKLAEPVNVAVMTGNVMETLYNIDGVSKELELEDNIWGGCGKMEQAPLAVSFGGPYVRVKNIQIQ
ncbi:metalloprotease TldD [Gottschalkia purinilytica]|uniref:Metalloprotease TldD n=1 Tax=Gottschalkia purinilytica TaxID=1503 RepID=A0A0L0W9I8_GOTPU|nr:TldD/PmbA family protein [Gottschalkia purinilytica]KNF08117.1 metalloprotease TldD [Gottschalkia purinilytica]